MRVSGASSLVLVVGVLLCHCSSDPGGQPGGNPPVDSGVRPPASAGHDLVYDDALQRVLLVNAGLGGTTAPPSTQPTQLWSWNGAQWRVLDSAGPPIRSLAGVAYDSARDVLVMHGGSYTVQVPYGDTWEWRADAGWRRIDVSGPGILDHTQMSDDPLHGQVVLFGGQRDLTTFPEDVWTFDGGQWTPLAGAGPGSRVHHAMQYHPGLGGVVVFGGFEPGASDRGDTWLWNGAWAEVAPPRLPRTHARMAFDEGRGTLVLVGGGVVGRRAARAPRRRLGAARSGRCSSGPVPPGRRLRPRAGGAGGLRRRKSGERRAPRRHLGARRGRVASSRSAVTGARRLPLLAVCAALCGGTAMADPPKGAAALLERAAQFYGAPASKEPGLWRLAWLGTSDLSAVDQARRPGLRLPTRAQDLLVIDPVGRRAALDTQRIGSDGTPGLWRHQTSPESGRSINRKSGLTFDAADRGRHLWERLAWRLPPLAIAEIRAAPERIRALTRAQDRGGPVDVVRFELSAGREVEIRIRPSGEVAGYAYLMNRLRGPARVVTRFEPSIAIPGIGKVPRGFTVDIGSTRWLALSVLDARRTPPDDDPWLRPPVTDTAPRPTIAGSPRRVEALFPGAWALRNIGGYNTFLVDVGGCLLLFDAIASFGSSDVVPPPPPRPLSDQVLEAVRTAVPDTPLCWVVPSHHHDDHLGGIVGLAAAGATVLTSPGNVALVNEVLRGVPGAKVEALRAPRVFDRGPSRLEIRQLEGLHAEEMLFAWFPEQRAALTADVTDYLVEEKRFLQLLDHENLVVETIHAVHSARPHGRAELDADLDFTN